MTKLISTILLVLAAVVASANSQALPTAIFHGFGDSCSNSGMKYITSTIAEETGAYAKCVEIGSGAVTSIFENFLTQAKLACKSILKNKNFDGEFNVLGLSQGGLIARYIVEQCPIKNKVRNLVSLGGPQMGVAASPHCFKGMFCDLINMIVKKSIFFGII